MCRVLSWCAGYSCVVPCPADQRGELARLDRPGALLDLVLVTRCKSLRFRKHFGERGFERRCVELAAARIVALCHAAEGVGRREREAGAHGLAPDRAADAAAQRAQESAKQLAAKLLEILRA